MELRGLRPLSSVPPGHIVRVVLIQGGWGFKRRLAELGIHEGSCLRVLKAGWGPVIVEVVSCDLTEPPLSAPLVIGFGIASKILVEIIGSKRD